MIFMTTRETELKGRECSIDSGNAEESKERGLCYV